MTSRSRKWVGADNELMAERDDRVAQKEQIDSIHNPTPFEQGQSPAAIREAFRDLRTELELLLGIYEARMDHEPHCREFALQLRRILGAR